MRFHNTIRACILMFGPLMALVAGCSEDPQVAATNAIASGNSFFEKDQYREAAVEYRRAVQLDPQSGEARYKLADSLLRTNNAAAGFRELVRAADLLPNDADLQVKVGTVLLSGGRFEDAKARAEKALAAQPQHVAALILRGNALVGLRDFDAGLTDMERAISAAPGRAMTYASLGALQYRRGEQEQAEAAFKKAVELEPKSIAARLTYAQYLMIAKRTDEAETELKAALALEPDNLLINRVMAVFYIALKRTPEAEPYLARLAKETDATAQLSLAQLYLASNRVDEGRKLLQGLAARDDSNFETATLLLARVAFVRDERPAAYSLVRQVLDKRPGSTPALVMQASFFLAESRLPDALRAATAATGADASSADAFLVLADARRAMRQIVEAKSAYTEVLKLRPTDGRAQVALSELNLLTGNVEEARRFAEQAAASAPQAVPARAAVAKAAVLARDFARAEREISSLLAEYPKFSEAHVLLGMLRMAEKDVSAAERAFSTAVDLRPASAEAAAGLMDVDFAAGRTASARDRADKIVENPSATVVGLILAAKAYQRLNNPERVEQVLRRAMQTDPSRSEPYVMLGQLYIQQRRIDQALREFQEVAQRQPTSVGAHTLVGALLHQQNRRGEAKAAYRKTLSIDRTAPVAANNLAWMMMEDNENIDEALQLAQAAKGRLPDSTDVADTLGWLYFKKGLSSRAIDELKPAVEKDPGNAGYRYHLGFVYAESGYFRQAQETLRAAVKLNPKAPEAAEAQKVLARLATN